MPQTSTAATDSATTPQDQILDILIGHWKSRVVGVAAELGLADFLDGGSLSVEVLWTGAYRKRIPRALR